MLTDPELIQLKRTKAFQKATGIGWRWVIALAANEPQFDIKPDLTNTRKFASIAIKRWVIAMELRDCSRRLLEQVLGRHNPATLMPEDIRLVCETHKTTQFWMRFDEERVRILFDHTISWLRKPEIRSLISQAVEGDDKDISHLLDERILELENLKDSTIETIILEKGFKTSQELERHAFYKDQKQRLIDINQRKLAGGSLGNIAEGDLIVEEPLQLLPGSEEVDKDNNND